MYEYVVTAGPGVMLGHGVVSIWGLIALVEEIRKANPGEDVSVTMGIYRGPEAMSQTFH
jgi:hypothetical protein